MSRKLRPHLAALAAACSVVLFTAACGASDPDNATHVSGEPVAGGTLEAIQLTEPRSLDPAKLNNTWVHQSLVGNALYGALITNDTETLETTFDLAADFSTADGGATFTLELRPGLTFTDGTPLDAAAVKYNWDRLLDPAVGSEAIRQASQIATSEVVSPTTLEITMVAPNPHYPEAAMASSMNWIASPTALEKGREAFDVDPVGAGPFTFTEWRRGDVIKLEKNPDYYDAPKPYLDAIEVRTVADVNQRANTMLAGGADLSSETNRGNILKADEAGLSTEIVPTGGGLFMGMNFRQAPFDDERARRAVALAVDAEAVNNAVYKGEGLVPVTLYPEESPYYEDLPFPEPDPETAQQLFDELAAEGKPVEFTILAYSTVELKGVAEAIQAQLSAFDNVDVKVDALEFVQAAQRVTTRDFGMAVTSAVAQDPDFALWTSFHSASEVGNVAGVNDPELDAALDAGRIATSVEDRKAAYANVQERLLALNPGIWYARATPSVVWDETVHGVDVYTLGSIMPEELWIAG
ncbi:ABC transporter substrate-binding protein [Rhodococcus sp. NPDC060086]|uniref:ABC transporter substrate-binding protein n=1 Tax=Rhodococcus sp. NPDC060086 TaxID=3347055 RepID=UPI00365D450F